jgi:peptidyl-prolyl cis-trans isomerase SurA
MLVLSFQVQAKAQALDGIAAVVNESIITKSELEKQVKMIEKQIQQSSHTTPDRAALEKQVLEHLITTEVQLQMAKRTGIQVDDIALDNAIENIAKQNQMSVTQLREAIAMEGLDYNHYRNNLRHQMIMSQLQQRDLQHDIQVSEQEINQFLQSPNGLGGMITEYRLGHILIPLSEAPSPEELETASQKVQLIVEKLKNGADFAQIALSESKGEHALHGGDLGWRKLPEMPTIFEKIVVNLKINEIPEPIRSSNGIHVIKLLDKRNAAAVAGHAKTSVRHILIKTNAVTSDNEAKARLSEIRQKILQGEDFGQLAKTHSSDLASASKGGNLGWVSKDVLVPEFSEVMESLEINDVSEPFKSSFGWHIMQVLERKTQTADETALRQKAKEMLQQRKFEEKQQTWARQLRDEAYVVTFEKS